MTEPPHLEQWLPHTWALLRRTQRVLNDNERRRAEGRGDKPQSPRYLYADSKASLLLNELGTLDTAQHSEWAGIAGAEAQLLDARQWMERCVSHYAHG